MPTDAERFELRLPVKQVINTNYVLYKVQEEFPEALHIQFGADHRNRQTTFFIRLPGIIQQQLIKMEKFFRFLMVISLMLPNGMSDIAVISSKERQVQQIFISIQ